MTGIMTVVTIIVLQLGILGFIVIAKLDAIRADIAELKREKK